MSRPGQKQLSPSQRAEIARRAGAGERPPELAAEFGVRARQIYRICHLHLTEAEFEARPGAKAVPSLVRVELIERAQAGEAVAALAREYGLDRGTIYRWVRAAKAAGHRPGGKAPSNANSQRLRSTPPE